MCAVERHEDRLNLLGHLGLEAVLRESVDVEIERELLKASAHGFRVCVSRHTEKLVVVLGPERTGETRNLSELRTRRIVKRLRRSRGRLSAGTRRRARHGDALRRGG